MSAALTVLSVFTTWTRGNARCSVSARLSVFATESVSPSAEITSGLATSATTNPSRSPTPAAVSASAEAPPEVALTSSSAWTPASASDTSRTSGCCSCHCA